VAFDASDGLLFTKDPTVDPSVQRREADGSLTPFAGQATADDSGDGGPATAAQLRSPYHVAASPDARRLFVSTTGDHRVRMLTLNPPAAPTGVTATPGNGEATVHWSHAGTPAATGFTAAVDGDPSLRCDAPAGQTQCTIAGLTNGTAYRFKVLARNTANGGDDVSAASAPSAPFTPSMVLPPNAPASLGASAGDGAVLLTWNPATANGTPVTGYTITGAPVGASVCPQRAALATSCLITGLANGTPYTFAVRATSSAGSGAAASATATPAALAPYAVPLSSVGVAGAATVAITDTPPGCTLAALPAITAAALAGAPGAPAQAAAPLGALGFTATGCAGATLHVSITYPPGALAGLTPYKFGPASAGAPHAWFPHGSIAGDTFSYTVQDDGVGDLETAAPGEIRDPAAPLRLAAAPAGAQAIPTLGEWGALLLSALLGLAGWHRLAAKSAASARQKGAVSY